MCLMNGIFSCKYSINYWKMQEYKQLLIGQM